MTHRPGKQTGISAVERVEGLFDGGKYQRIYPALLGVLTQPLRTEKGGKRQGCHGRDNHDDAHNPAQLTEQNTGHTGNEGQGEEHRQHGEGRSDNRDGHLVGTMYGRLLGGTATFNVVGNVFEHHDGIVDHHTDGDTQRAERYDVQRITRHQQITERGNKRDRYGNDDNERGAPTSQEEEHHEHHNDEGYQNGLYQTADGVLDVGRRIDDDTQFHVGRERRLYDGQFPEHLVGDVHRVGTRLFLYHNHTALLAIVISLLLTLFHGIDHTRHIAQTDNGTVGIGTDHNVLKLLCRT